MFHINNLVFQDFIHYPTLHLPKDKIAFLQGATPKKILLPLVNESLETAMIPSVNSMLGMGIVSLPGMMTVFVDIYIK